MVTTLKITGLIVLTDLLLAALVVAGAGRAARQAGFSVAARFRLVVTLVVVLGLWLGVAFAVSRARLDVLHPLVLGLIGGPVVVGWLALVRFESWREVVRAVPQSWLVGAQCYRCIGALFLVLWGGGHLPAFFAVPAGVGDVLTGVGALVVALLVVKRVGGWQRAVRGWNLFGIADLLVAVGAGSTILAGPLTTVFAAETTTAVLVAFPLGLIPLFLVPVSLTLHVYSLSNLAAADPPARSLATTDEPSISQSRS